MQDPQTIADIQADIKVIKAALLGHEGNSKEGVLAITRDTERRVSKLETERSTIWAAIVAIPIVAAALTFFMPELPASRPDRSSQ